jgi:hypothetical protein
MKETTRTKRNVDREIITDLKEMNQALAGGVPRAQTYTVRTVVIVPLPSEYDAGKVGKTHPLRSAFCIHHSDLRAKRP